MPATSPEALDRQRIYKRLHKRAHRDRQSAYHRAWKDRHRDQYLASKAKYRRLNKEKTACRAVVNRAIKRGDIIRPSTCSECPAVEVQAHHEDYGKPYEIIWLCRTCHGKRHRRHV